LGSVFGEEAAPGFTGENSSEQVFGARRGRRPAERQVHPERGAAPPPLARSRQTAAVCADERARDREPQAETAQTLPRLLEGLEDARDLRRLDADARVGNLDGDAAGRGLDLA